MKRIIACLLILACAACSAGAPGGTYDISMMYPREGVVRVTDDPGGFIGYRMAHIKALRVSGGRVVIDGECASACTLYLSLEKACITPRARLGFHGLARATGKPLPERYYMRRIHQLASFYQPAIRDWFLSGPAWDAGHMEWIGYEQAVQMGVKPCGSEE